MNLFVQQKAQRSYESDWARNPELLLGAKASLLEFFHGLIDVDPVLGVNLTDQFFFPPTRVLQGNFECASARSLPLEHDNANSL